LWLARVAVLAFTAAELETATKALPGLMAPFHRCAAAEAALEGGFDLLRGHDPDSKGGGRR
jgi:hypothetical protein